MERIGEFVVRRLLGEGGMGKVYEAQERLSGRTVALKVLRPELASAEAARQAFRAEMAILAHLDHPNIVRSLSCHEIEGQLVMVLELLDGPTLREILTRRAGEGLPWQEAVEIAAQIAAALGAAHQQDPPIVHRDLKPENVIVLRGGRVKVTDFGIAKVLEAAGPATTHAIGTLQYMSPEQIDAGPLDARTDLYTLGLVFYELLAGRPPFESASPRTLLNLHCTAAPPPLPAEVRQALPRGIEQLLGRLLAKAPEDRPADAREVLTALEPFRSAEAPGSIELDAPSTTAAKPATARRPSEASAVSLPQRLDTVAMVERLDRPFEVPMKWAVAIVLALSACAGAVTYELRSASASTSVPHAR